MSTDKDPAKGADDAARPSSDAVHSAGDYEVARDDDDAVREFVEAGEVQKSPHDAAPEDLTRSEEEAEPDPRQQGVTRPPQGN